MMIAKSYLNWEKKKKKKKKGGGGKDWRINPISNYLLLNIQEKLIQNHVNAHFWG